MKTGLILNYGRNNMEDIIKQILIENINQSTVNVEGGDAKYTVKIISDAFLDKTIIERHKMVYALLDKYIKSGEIHALTIKAQTTDGNK